MLFQPLSTRALTQVSLAGVYPIPAAAPLSCIPALLGAVALYLWLLPERLLTPTVRVFLQFNFVNWWERPNLGGSGLVLLRWPMYKAVSCDSLVGIVVV